jgi:hypothetical protein
VVHPPGSEQPCTSQTNKLTSTSIIAIESNRPAALEA